MPTTAKAQPSASVSCMATIVLSDELGVLRHFRCGGLGTVYQSGKSDCLRLAAGVCNDHVATVSCQHQCPRWRSCNPIMWSVKHRLVSEAAEEPFNGEIKHAALSGTATTRRLSQRIWLTGRQQEDRRRLVTCSKHPEKYAHRRRQSRLGRRVLGRRFAMLVLLRASSVLPADWI